MLATKLKSLDEGEYATSLLKNKSKVEDWLRKNNWTEEEMTTGAWED